MTADVHVVAVGARTPVGLDAESTAAALRADLSGLGEHPILVDGAGNPLKCARDARFDPALSGPVRLVGLGVTALAEVLAKLAVHRPPERVLPVLLALPEPRPGFGADAAREVVRGIGAAALPGAARVEVEVAGAGHAGALRALELASSRLQQRQATLCVVGGLDSYLDADALDWLDGEGRLAQDGTRGGFIPGEAAGMLALSTLAEATSLGLPSLARLRAVATDREPQSVDSPEGWLGEGLSAVVRRATAGLRLPEERVDDIYCDLNGERHRSDDWGFMVLRVASAFRDGTAYVSPVGGCGDVGAASGALGCVLAVQAFRRRYARGPRSLVCGSSDGGLRAAALLERQES